MERELMIMRHGNSAWDTGADTDFDRTLSQRGVADTIAVGKRLLKENLIPDHVLSSSAVRTTQTTMRLCTIAGISQSDIRWDSNLYNCSVDFWIESIRSIPDTINRLLVVGHIPALAELIQLITVQPVPVPDDGKLLPTSALARVRVLVPWSELGPKCAALVDVSRPQSVEFEVV